MKHTLLFLLLCAMYPLYTQHAPLRANNIIRLGTNLCGIATQKDFDELWEFSGVERAQGHTFFPLPIAYNIRATDEQDSTELVVFGLNRLRLDGGEPVERGKYGGDILSSPLIQIDPRKTTILSFAYQRTGKAPAGAYNRGWCDNLLIGPEPRVIHNGNTQNVLSQPDRLVVEFTSSSTNVTNIPDSLWQRHRLPNGTLTARNSAFTLFGAGGTQRGFSETNPNSALTPVQGLRANIYDDGRDQRFHHVSLTIPSWLPQKLLGEPDNARYFRFRFRVEAADNGTEFLPDDGDDFYLANIQLLSYYSGIERADLTVVAASVDNPYTIMPERQATALPVAVWVANAAPQSTSEATLYTTIEPDVPTVDANAIYRDTTSLVIPAFSSELRIVLPPCNVSQINKAHGVEGRDSMRYRLTTWIVYADEENELNTSNDTLHTIFSLRFGKVFAYDEPTERGENAVGKFSNQRVFGLNLKGYSVGGTNWRDHINGTDVGNGSGYLGMRFTLVAEDTLTGFQSYMANFRNEDFNIEFSVRRDSNGLPEAGWVSGTKVWKRAGLDELHKPEDSNWETSFDQYVTQLLKPAIILKPGTYWLFIKQLGSEGIHLGGSAYRMGIITTNVVDHVQPGSSNTTLMLNKAFREYNAQGELVNREVFTYINGGIPPSPPVSFMPTVGNPGYAHHDAQGTVESYTTFSRGTWIPMVRPYFGAGHPPDTTTTTPDTTTTTSTVSVVLEAVPTLTQNAPNPARDVAVVQFVLTAPTPTHVRLTVCDVLGREFLRPIDTILPFGTYTVHIPVGTIPNGMYFYRLETPNGTLVRTMTVVR